MILPERWQIATSLVADSSGRGKKMTERKGSPSYVLVGSILILWYTSGGAGSPSWFQAQTDKRKESSAHSQEDKELEWVIRTRTGYLADKELTVVHPDGDGSFRIELKEWDRIEIHLPDTAQAKKYEGFYLVGKDLRRLPIGSSFDEEKGIFY